MTDPQWLTSLAGVKMPPIVYGTAWKKDRTSELVGKAVRAGFRGIDTACQPKHYNEPQVGEALAQLQEDGIHRDDLFVQTKFTPLSGQDPKRIPYDQKAPIDVQVLQSLAASKLNLRTHFIDSWILHSPVHPYDLLLQVWQTMETPQMAGEVGQLGISNCYDLKLFEQLFSDATVKPAVVQNRFHQRTGYDAELRRFCLNHGVIYQSFWTLTANPHILNSPTLQAKARKYQKTEAQVFFRCLSQIGIVPLTGTTSEHHMTEDLGIFNFELSALDLEEVASLLK